MIGLRGQKIINLPSPVKNKMELTLPKKTCLVSIDVEEEPYGEKTFLGVENLGSVLEIFGRFDIKATLFVTGEVLETYPHLVKN